MNTIATFFLRTAIAGKRATCRCAIAATVFLGCSQCPVAATTTFYGDLATFSAAAGTPLLTQDFEGYPAGTDLNNVELLPGISATSNFVSVQAFESTSRVLFASGDRASGTAFYDVNFALPYTAASLEIAGFESVPGNPSTAVDSGMLSVFLAGSSSLSLPISGNATGANIFVGVISDIAITKIHWAEAHEANGGNEETALDNFRMRAVPEPSALLHLVALSCAAILGRRRLISAV